MTAYKYMSDINEYADDYDNYDYDNYDYDSGDTVTDVDSTAAEDIALGKNATVAYKNSTKYDRENYLTADEQRECIRKYRETGDKTYRDKLVLSNIALVHHVLHRFHYAEMAQGSDEYDYDDLVQVGVMGLFSAIDKYDESAGTTFNTYAFLWVRQRITRYISDVRGAVRVPIYMRAILSKLAYVRLVLRDAGIEPTIATMSQETGLPEDVLQDIMQYDCQKCSVDAPVSASDEHTKSLGDYLSVDDESAGVIMQTDISKTFETALNKLPQRTRDIICMRLGVGVYTQPHTLQEVADTYGLTRERVRQITLNGYRRLNCDKNVRALAEAYGYKVTDDRRFIWRTNEKYGGH